MMKRRLSLRLLITATLLLVPSAALPCQCGDMPEDLYAAVFEGRVERISRIEPRWRDMRRGAVLALYDWLNLDRPPDWISAELLEQEQYGVNVTFRVTSYWKGVGGKTIDVRTGFWIGDCGYPFETGQVYRVWAYTRTPTRFRFRASSLQTSLCTKTSKVSGRVEARPLEDVHAFAYPMFWTPLVLASVTGLAIGWLAQRLPVRRLAQDALAWLAADVCGVVAFGVLFPVLAAIFAEPPIARPMIPLAHVRWNDSLTQAAALLAFCLVLSPALALAARSKWTAGVARNHGLVCGVLGGACAVSLHILMHTLRGTP